VNQGIKDTFLSFGLGKFIPKVLECAPPSFPNDLKQKIQTTWCGSSDVSKKAEAIGTLILVNGESECTCPSKTWQYAIKLYLTTFIPEASQNKEASTDDDDDDSSDDDDSDGDDGEGQEKDAQNEGDEEEDEEEYEEDGDGKENDDGEDDDGDEEDDDGDEEDDDGDDEDGDDEDGDDEDDDEDN
jgi:hypothetical protein